MTEPRDHRSPPAVEVGQRVLVRGELGHVVGPQRKLGISDVVAVVLDRDAFPRYDLTRNVEPFPE